MIKTSLFIWEKCEHRFHSPWNVGPTMGRIPLIIIASHSDIACWKNTSSNPTHVVLSSLNIESLGPNHREICWDHFSRKIAKFHRHLHRAASIELARHTRQLQQYGPRPLQRAWAASWTMELSAETGDFLLWFPEMWPNRSNSWMVYFMENPTNSWMIWG